MRGIGIIEPIGSHTPLPVGYDDNSEHSDRSGCWCVIRPFATTARRRQNREVSGYFLTRERMMSVKGLKNGALVVILDPVWWAPALPERVFRGDEQTLSFKSFAKTKNLFDLLVTLCL